MFAAAGKRRFNPAPGPTPPDHGQHLSDDQKDPHTQDHIIRMPPWLASFSMLSLSSNVALCDAAVVETEELPTLIQQADEAVELAREKVKCPGQFMDGLSEISRVTNVDVFDGLKFDLSKQLAQTFGVSHQLWVGSPTAAQQGRSYVFTTHATNEAGEAYAVGSMTTDRSVSLRGAVPLTTFGVKSTGITLKPTLQLGSNDAWNMQIDQASANNACRADLSQGTMSFSFNQAITPRLSVGMDLSYVDVPQVQQTACSYGGKYATPEYSLTGLVAQGGLQTQYQRKVSPRVTLASEMQYNPKQPSRSSVAMAMEVSLKPSRLHFSIDGSGTVCSLVELHILPSANLTLSGRLNHAENKQAFGFGLQMQA